MKLQKLSDEVYSSEFLLYDNRLEIVRSTFYTVLL